MINIAYLVHNLQAGGIERSVTRIVNGLDKSQYASSIICLARTGPAEKWLNRNVPIFQIKKRPGNDLRSIRHLASCLQSRGIDIVQSHNWGTLVECALARKYARIPFHIHAERGTVMGTVNPKGFRHWVRARVMSTTLRSVNKVMSNAHSVAGLVEQRCGYSADKIAVIPNGVPGVALENKSQSRLAIRKQLGVDSDTVLIGSVGRLVHVKGFDLAIQAFAKVLEIFPKVHFVLVGEGFEQRNLMRLVSKVGVVKQFHFVGHQEKVSPWLLAMDLYINSSRSEGMSQSVVEAMSAALPIVATDVGDNARLVSHPSLRCGLLCSSQDVDSLADSMLELLSNTPKREEFARAAVQCHTKNYSEERFMGAIHSLYERVLANE